MTDEQRNQWTELWAEHAELKTLVRAYFDALATFHAYVGDPEAHGDAATYLRALDEAQNKLKKAVGR